MNQKRINLWVVFIAYTPLLGYGWVRLFSTWYGIAWKPAGAPLLFSERYGHTKTLVAFGYRFQLIKPVN